MSNPGQRGGVALGVPQTRVLCPNQFQARQFEYHPSLPLMAIGTVDGQVYLADWDRNQQMGHATMPAMAPHGQQLGADEGINVLAVAWLRRDPTRFVAAAAHGGAALFSVDLSSTTAHLAEEAREALEADGSRPWGTSSRSAPAAAAAASSSSAPAADPNALSLVHRFNAPLAPKLTSMHCNADDTLLSGSGYTHSVFISDMATGFKLRTLKNIHEGHVNIARFANQLPYLLLTSSFDHSCKMFDLRSNHTVRRGDVDVPVPIYTCSSRSGNVMVCFSPNDTYFLSSAVDNEVRQYHVRDGSLHLEYDIPKHNIATNYTRSYYANEGECIISGASNSDLLYVASSVDGSIIDTVDMVEGRREKHLYIQSLRGCPLPNSGHNRCTVLLYFRANTNRPYELVEVNLNRDPAGQARELPMSLGSLRTLSDDYRRFLNTDLFADVVISCGGATGDQLIYAHQAVLRARWRWFAKHAQWNAEATQALNDAQAAAAAAAAASLPVAATAAASSSGSLDDDDDLPMSTPACATAAGATAAAAPLVFCRIQVPHPSFDEPVAASSASASAAAASPPTFDTITLSSTGMVSIDFPLLSRSHCLRLLEHIYTGSVAIETSDHDPAKDGEKKATGTKHATSAGSSSSSAAAVKKAAAAPLSAPASVSSSSLGGLDDEEDEVQRAIAASLTPSAVVRQASAADLSPLISDLQSALVAMSLRAPHSSDTPLPVRTLFSLPPLPPSFTEQLALFIPTLPAHYDLPRLANILERSIRRLLTLATHQGKASKETALATAAAASAASSSSAASLSALPSVPVAPFSDFSALDTFASQLRSCVQYDARGVVQCAQDLILRTCDWLRFKHPRFLAQLPLIFPPHRSNFVAEVQRALHPPDATRQPYSWHVISPAIVTVHTGGATSADSMAIAFGGFNPKISVSQTEVQAINPTTLAVTPLSCSADHAKAMPDPGAVSPTSLCAMQSADGTAMQIYALSSHDTSLLSLDLNTLHWRSHKLHGPESRIRSKNSMTAVPYRDRIYLFGGRDRHNVFAELAYLERESASGEWAQHAVLDLASNAAGSNAPVPRYGHCAVYSKDAGGLVVFGGWGVTGVRNDVWVLNLMSHTWERKCDNDRSMMLPGQDADDYVARVHSGQFRETIPLPRCHSSASVVTLEGREHLAIFGGLTPFQLQQVTGRDLWLLDLTTFQWRKMPTANDLPPRPVPQMPSHPSQLASHLEVWERRVREWERLMKPTRRYQHASFVGSSAAAVGAASSSASRSDSKLCILGGSHGMDGSGISWLDVYDFSTHMWSREESHLAGVSSMEPLINITDSGCLWQDMQRRFQTTQPMAFSQPTIEAAEIPNADAFGASSSVASSSGLSACIRFNLSHEQALFHHPSPLPAGSFIHFVCEGRVLTVPKLILVSRCSTFLAAITSSMRDEALAKEGVISIEGVRYVVFRCILYFLYCGDIEFDIQVAPAASSICSRSASSSQLSSRSASAANSARGSKRQATDDASVSTVIGSGSLDDEDEEVQQSLPLSSLHMDERSGGELVSSGAANGSKKTRHAKTNDEEEAKSSPVSIHLSIAEHSLDAAAIHEAAAAAAAAASSSSSCSPSLLRVDPLELLVASDRFGLSSLCSVLEIGLSRQLDVSVACKFAQVADTFHLGMLRERCIIFIAQQFEEIQASYSSDYQTLSASTRECIEKTLHSLAGSHRGLHSRNESNPLVLPAALAAQAPLITLAGKDQPAAEQLQQLMADAEEEEEEDGGSMFGDDEDDEVEEGEDEEEDEDQEPDVEV